MRNAVLNVKNKIQNAFDVMVNRRRCQNTARHSLLNVINDHLGMNLVDICLYCLTKISIRAKRSISRVFSLFIVPSPFLYVARRKAVLTGLKAYWAV